jgi:hypothetical protein
VLRHRWSKRVSIWPEPPPKSEIRRTFKANHPQITPIISNQSV